MPIAASADLETSTRLRRPANTKQGKGTAPAYRYYAGFSPEFVRDIIEDHLPNAGLILDPWNGAGTTTTVAAELGCEAVGIDVNPAMLIVARARLSDDDSWKRVLDAVPDVWAPASGCTEVLERWFTRRSARLLRGFERAFTQHVGGSSSVMAYDSSETLTPTQALAAVVVAGVTRKLLSPFQTSNPTWLRLNPASSARLEVTRGDIRRAVQEYQSKGSPFPRAQSQVLPKLRLGNSESLEMGAEQYDLVLTSPPYCTRLDYVIATLPELAAMGVPDWQTVQRLRGQMLGGPSRHQDAAGVDLVDVCDLAREFLSTVRGHPSKAAQTYYWRFYCSYFTRYARTIKRIVDAMKPSATAVLVVQDSHFKNLQVRLADYSVAQAEAAGLRVVDQWSIPVPNPKALNPANRRYRTTNATRETVIVCRKEILA